MYKDSDYKENECPCCGLKIKTCPHCGKSGKAFGPNLVGCSDISQCGSEVDFGHWLGQIHGKPDVHWVVEHWNKRV